MTDLSMNEELELKSTLSQAASAGVRVMGLRISSYAVGFVASVLIARALGPHGRGLYAYPVALLGIAVAIGHVGLEFAQVFLAGKGHHLRSMWANATVFSFTVGTLAWAIVTALTAINPHLFGKLPLAWISIPFGLLPLLLMNLYWANLLQLSGRLISATRAAWLGVAMQCLTAALLFALHELTPFRVLLMQWVTNGTTWLLLLRQSKRAGLVNLSVDGSLLRKALAFGMKSYLGQISFFLLLQIDQLLVRNYAGYGPLGLYSLAVTLGGLLWLLTDPLAAALLPHQVRAQGGDGRRLGFSMARLSLSISLLVATMAWILAPIGIRIVYGDSFGGSVWAFRLLLPGIVALTVARPLGAVLVKEGRAWLLSGLGLLALAINIAMNVVLIPRIGIEGASIASSVCYVAVAVAYVVATRRERLAGWRDLRPRWSDYRLLRSAFARRKPARRDGPPRIALVVGSLRRGGTEGQVVRLATGLRKRGCDVTIVCLGEDGGMGHEARAAGTKVLEANFHGFHGFRNKGILAPLRPLGRMRRMLQEAEPDVVHCFLYWSYMIGVPIAWRLRIPAIISSRRSLFDVSGSRKSLRIWERISDRLSDMVVCNSEAVRQDAETTGHVPRNKLTVILNGVRIPERVEPVDPQGYILTVANFGPHKGHQFLLRAFAKAREAADLSWLQLRLAGTGIEETGLRQLAQELGIEDALEWLGVVPEPGELFEGCMFSILPSTSEGMPNAVLESLAAGRPVIGSDIGGISEILRDAGGLLVPPGDASALAEAIRTLARNPLRATSLGNDGRLLVESRYGVERMVDETLSLYESCLREKGVRLPTTSAEPGVPA